MPQAFERAHFGHPDFRVGGKVFATLDSPEPGWAMVKLLPEQQDLFVHSDGKTFRPVKGAWGQKGATNVRLASAGEQAVGDALRAAWLNTAPRKIVEQSGVPLT